MNYLKLLNLAALVCALPAFAAVPAEEAKQLGTTLTPIGAEKAGNKEGTIPEWTGQRITPPAGHKKGSGKPLDPFADEKPRLTITAKDMPAHADKLTEGTKEMLKRYPTMRVDVYPTHRLVNYPQRILDNTHKNALAAKSTEGGLSIQNVMPGFPFAIPKSGYEAMWNHLLGYRGVAHHGKWDNYIVTSSNTKVLSTTGEGGFVWPIYDPKKTGVVSDTDPYFVAKLFYSAPARRAGEAVLAIDSVDPLKQPRRAWQYLPGQRRVKLAPELANDTANPGSGGGATWDDGQVFNGAMDRYDFKLLGKKEMYIPYSDYKLVYFAQPAEVFATPNHVNPDVVRWELHRVWAVEATLKPGKRHIYTKRVFYLDEDSWTAVAADEYDALGKLYRASFSYLTFSYDSLAAINDTYSIVDFNTGSYFISALGGAYPTGFEVFDQMPDDSNYASPEALAGGGIR